MLYLKHSNVLLIKQKLHWASVKKTPTEHCCGNAGNKLISAASFFPGKCWNSQKSNSPLANQVLNFYRQRITKQREKLQQSDFFKIFSFQNKGPNELEELSQGKDILFHLKNDTHQASFKHFGKIFIVDIDTLLWPVSKRYTSFKSQNRKICQTKEVCNCFKSECFQLSNCENMNILHPKDETSGCCHIAFSIFPFLHCLLK